MPLTERASQSLARKPTSLSVTWTGYARRSSKAPRFQPDEGRPTVARHLQRLPPRTFLCWRNEAYVACTFRRRTRALFQRRLWVNCSPSSELPGLPVYSRSRTYRIVALSDANGTDRPRSGPQRLPECVGACQEKEHHHASLDQPRSGHHRNRYGQEHASHDRPRFPRRHRVAREGVTWTHCIEACEPAALSHWHRSGDGDALRCSRACRAVRL